MRKKLVDKERGFCVMVGLQVGWIWFILEQSTVPFLAYDNALNFWVLGFWIDGDFCLIGSNWIIMARCTRWRFCNKGFSSKLILLCFAWILPIQPAHSNASYVSALTVQSSPTVSIQFRPSETLFPQHPLIEEFIPVYSSPNGLSSIIKRSSRVLISNRQAPSAVRVLSLMDASALSRINVPLLLPVRIVSSVLC